jgi:MFS family permease
MPTGSAYRDPQFWKFSGYGFLKNLRFFDPFLLLFFRDAGLSFLAIGTLISIRELSTNLLELPTGVLADVFGRRKAMIMGFAAYIVSFCLFYIGHSFWAFTLAMLFFSVGETLRSGTHKAMIMEHIRRTGHEQLKVAYYGRTRSASQFGSAISSLIAAGLVFWTGSYRIIFLATIAPYIANLALLSTYPRALDGEHLEGESASLETLKFRLILAMRDVIGLFRSPKTLRGLLTGAGFDAVQKTSKDYLQPIVKAQALAFPLLLGLTGEQRAALLIGAVYFLIYLGTCAASGHAGAVHRLLRSPARSLNLTLLMAPALLLIAGLSVHLELRAVAIGAFVLLFLLQNLRRPMVVGYLADHMPHRAMAAGLSVEVQIRTVGVAVLAPALGALADRVGIGPGLAIVSLAALVVFPLAFVRDTPSAEDA